jgi:hypothetical protein
VDGDAANASGVAHADTLVRFAEAVVGDDDAALARARDAVAAELGPEELVDAAAVASNFERMVRIADSIGIPLDGALSAMTEDLRQDLGLDRFGAAANTPTPGVAQRTLGQVMRPAVHGALRLVGRFRGRSSR